MSNQPALDASGNLKDASEIQWFHDKDDDVAMSGPPAPSEDSAAHNSA
jgi:hypothetical protein